MARTLSVKRGDTMLAGCFTAIVTPFKNGTVDYEGLGKLSEFQIKNGIVVQAITR